MASFIGLSDLSLFSITAFKAPKSVSLYTPTHTSFLLLSLLTYQLTLHLFAVIAHTSAISGKKRSLHPIIQLLSSRALWQFNLLQCLLLSTDDVSYHFSCFQLLLFNFCTLSIAYRAQKWKPLSTSLQLLWNLTCKQLTLVIASKQETLQFPSEMFDFSSYSCICNCLPFYL